MGQIIMFGGNYAIRGFANCDGQLVPISEHNALYSILGTTYGGDGRTTFGLPDLRGRVPIHQGRGNGLSDHRIGELGGVEHVALTGQQVPSHTHHLMATSEGAGATEPEGKVLAESAGGEIYGDAQNLIQMDSQAIGNTGGGQGHANMQPYLCINFLICLEGVYPPRT
jgi:microcystin-dependent protein